MLEEVRALIKNRAHEFPLVRHRTAGWCTFLVLPLDESGRSAGMSNGVWWQLNVRDVEPIRIGDRVRIDGHGEGNIFAFAADEKGDPLIVVRLDTGNDMTLGAAKVHPA